MYVENIVNNILIHVAEIRCKKLQRGNGETCETVD